jgi:hypothetical protein
MRPNFSPEDFEYEVSEAVDNRRLSIEAWSRVHHAKDPTPSGDSVEVSQLAIQTSENGQASKSGR